MSFLEYLLVFSIILACLSLMHKIPNRALFWVSLVLSAMYGACAVALPSWPAAVMSGYMLACAFLRVWLAEQQS